MARYFLDQEFHEYHYKPLFGRKVHIIDLISIGIACEDGRTYYAISKDFDIKAAWYSYQMEQVSGDQRNIYPEGIKKYWLRDNVLKQIWIELESIDNVSPYSRDWAKEGIYPFTYNRFKKLILKYGKTNEEIAFEVKEFCKPYRNYSHEGIRLTYSEINYPEFYGYFADYDWVLFCSLFGKMINLPKGFPYYCRDLKQMVDEKAEWLVSHGKGTHSAGDKLYPADFETALNWIEKDACYPKQENEHNALADAVWNLALYKFLQSF